MRSVPCLLLAAIFAGVAALPANSGCLPASIFAKTEDGVRTAFDLGRLDGAPALCATAPTEGAPRLGCWKLDPSTGALTDVAITAVPGYSERIAPDAKGCVAGYCPGPSKGEPMPLLVVTSTDGAHTAVLVDYTLHIFSTADKAHQREIALMDEKAPDRTNVGLMPTRMLYVGNTIFIVASAAGPQTAVYAFRQDGERLGFINVPPKTENMFDVFQGGVSIVEPDRVALVETGFRSLVLYSVASGATTRLLRATSAPGCTREHIQRMNEGDLSVPAPCRRTLRARFEPYFDMSPIRLPSGDLLTTLTGPGAGFVAVLDGKTLQEKKRIRLPRCS